jgi:predicted esterase
MSIKRNRFASVLRKHECATDDEFRSRLAGYSSLFLIDKADTYPTTYLLHGAADSAAPVGPSQEFYSKLRAKGFKVEADWVDGAEHSFDVFIAVRFAVLPIPSRE